MPVHTLSFYSTYRCGRSGACCTAGWSIPVEADLLPILKTELLIPDNQGRCPQFDRGSGLCAVQRDHGEDTLPGTCSQFPRRALIDERGTFVTLSNFCPTAAALLYDSPSPATILTSPPAFPANRRYEGLDARGQWPPLVRPGLLFDLDSYSRWEQFIVETLTTEGPLDTAFATLTTAAETLRRWTRSDPPFDAWVTTALADLSPRTETVAIFERFRGANAFDRLRLAVPDGLDRTTPFDGAFAGFGDSGDHRRAARRYLASKAFASWSAYDGHGVRTLIAELFAADLVLRVECARACRKAGRSLDRSLMIEAIRQSDLLLVHLVERPRMMTWLSEIELVN